MPPTGGFLAKFAVLSAAIAAGRTGLALAMVAASGVAIFYYLRILVVMYMEPAAEAKREAGGVLTVDNTPVVAAGSSVGSLVALTALVAIVLAIGLYPEPWLRAVGAAVASVIGG